MIHVYYGEGKGKTTAAAGLALRALGNGLSVLFLQFMKARASGEITRFSALSGIAVLRNSIDCGFYRNMTEAQKTQMTRMHNENIEKVFALLDKGCDLLVLDEVFSAYEYNLLDKSMVRQLYGMAENNQFELVLTGRRPDAVFIQGADYITEMKKERHPFDRGVSARQGIEY